MLLETMLAACLLPAAPLQERATGVNQATLLAKPEYDQILDGSRDLAFSSSVDSGRRVSHNMTHEIEEQARRISDVALSIPNRATTTICIGSRSTILLPKTLLLPRSGPISARKMFGEGRYLPGVDHTQEHTSDVPARAS